MSEITNIGSKQDPDDYRDQAVDREREAQELKMPVPFKVTEETLLKILMP